MPEMVGFSEFEVKSSAVKLNEGSDTFTPIGCVGTLGQVLNTRTVTKKCEGKIVKKRTYHSGDGELTVSLHMQYSVYKKLWGMSNEKLKDGIIGYGSGTHPEFTYVCEAVDEDGNIKYKAYPRCVLNSGPAVDINNENDTVTEITVTIGIANDANGFCMYEALASELAADVKGKWLNAWTSDMMLKGTVQEGA